MFEIMGGPLASYLNPEACTSRNVSTSRRHGSGLLGCQRPYGMITLLCRRRPGTTWQVLRFRGPNAVTKRNCAG